ncbi:MAG: hypothetical protein ACTTJH_04420 [Bacteroidales bacterium]
MKNILVFSIIALVFTLFSCTNKEEQRQREQHLRDSFNTILDKKTQQVQTLDAQMRDIDENLMNISSRYAELRQIASSDASITENVAKHIEIQINAIAEFLAKDKQKIAYIQSQLAKQNNQDAKVTELQNRINELNVRIAKGEEQITSLTDELKGKNIKLDNLNSQVTKLQAESQKNKSELIKLEDERYKGFFIVGTKKELNKLGLIDTKGGFVGLGRTITLAKNGDISMMQRIDIRNVKEIPLTGQKVELLTPHPASSYSWQGIQNKPSAIMIENSEEFWQATRCLVILVK